MRHCNNETKTIGVTYESAACIQGKITHLTFKTIPETWRRSSIFCPNCGEQSVWEAAVVGDHFLCTHCAVKFEMPGGIRHVGGQWDGQRLAALEGLAS